MNATEAWAEGYGAGRDDEAGALPIRANPYAITDHPYRPDRQGQWHTGRCDTCGEPEAAHLTG